MSSKEVDVLLFGLGAIGSFYAFILSRSTRVKLTVVARSNYDAVKTNGLQINSDIHGQHLLKLDQVVRSPAELKQKFDYVVCAHKAINQSATPALIASVVDQKKTTIILIQNGVGNEEPFRNFFPQATILSSVTWVGAVQTEPGVVHHRRAEDMQLGLFPNAENDQAVETQRLETFAALLREGNTKFSVVPNIQIQRWEKVIWNVAWNSLTALTTLNTHAWLESSDNAVPLTRRLMNEVIDVAQKCDVPIEHELVDLLMKRIAELPPIESSMQVDCRNERPMEVDIILGYPVRRARELGVDVPTLETLYAILTALNGKFLKSRSEGYLEVVDGCASVMLC